MCSRRKKGIWLVAVFAALLGLTSGCSTWRMFITLRADAETNQGRPIAVLIRSISEQDYRKEPYAVLAQLATQPDKSVLRMLTLQPKDRLKKRLWLSVPAKTPVAIYFLYTSQTGSWKMLLVPPLPWSASVPLGRHGVEVEDVSECRFLRWQ